ncbi:hypothetical protein [Nonomuraea africana]|uniref:Uncharacterized protein n=1 Tax=Nonomuraea africana TaxID=46171 RepID=A0ABR9KI09_9ACTN|nr:hypothetical protein [Nonomuraea africana]MBE1561450.1 hypothetical protein [Nonomuraea africana]
MAHLLDTLDDEVPITYGQFMLRGVSGLQGVHNRVHLAELDRQVYLYASAEHSRVRVEVWDGEPPPWEGHGKLVADALCVAETGVVAVTPYMFAGSGRSVLIGPAFFEYGLHLYAHNAERLLRFWPIKDVFDPAVHLRPDAVDAEAKPQEAVETRSTADDWVSIRIPGTGEAPAPVSPARAEEEWPLDREHELRLAELLGDLRPRLLTRPPTWLLDTDEGNRRRYLNELRSSVATARRLNPDGLPTFQLASGELGERPCPGLSYRLWQWRPIEEPQAASPEGFPPVDPEAADQGDASQSAVEAAAPHAGSGAGRPAPETLTAEREVRALDVLRRRRLVTGIVTVLREENGVVEVRDALPAEVARVLAAERAWALD